MLLIISQRLQEHQKLPAVSDDKHKICAHFCSINCQISSRQTNLHSQLQPSYVGCWDVFSRLMNRNISPLHIHFLKTFLTSALPRIKPISISITDRLTSFWCLLPAGRLNVMQPVSLWTSSSLSWPNLASSTHSPFTYSIELNIMNPLLRNNRKKRGRCILLQAAVPSCHSAEILPRLSL